ncbi:MAG: aldo/keto reductase [Nitrospirae bacterium]|nr:aldo/keto reductase [Nitrospirota bacterium]
MDRSFFRPLGRTGSSVHPLGFGSYRIGEGNDLQEAALRSYLDRGGNLIDTSANYTDGQSERLIGRVIKDYPRDGLILVTKGGYIQGQNMALAKSRSFPEVVAYADGLWHCIHPEFLETQIRLSAERLQVGTIDIYLLHNPEYYLTQIAHHGKISAADHDEFYRRIREAFRFLEEKVRTGRIRWYGISSNHYGLPASDQTATSVARCLAVAREVADEPHFSVVQLPMNLFESGGALEANNEGQTVLEFCRSNGIGVLVNRPLNAFSKNQMIRLADFIKPGFPPPGPEAIRSLLQPLRRHEERFSKLFTGSKESDVGTADMLEQIIPQLQSPAHLEQAVGPYIIEPVKNWLSSAQEEFGRRPEWNGWQKEFVELINGLFEEISRYLASLQQGASDAVRRRLIEAGYPASTETLSQMAIRVLLSLPGLSCVLVGMRRTEYVQDLMDLPSTPPMPGEEILHRFKTSQ